MLFINDSSSSLTGSHNSSFSSIAISTVVVADDSVSGTSLAGPIHTYLKGIDFKKEKTRLN